LQLDLSGNQLCGVDEYGEGTYTAEGITAIADALRVHGGLTVANLLGNQLDVKSAKILAEVAKQKGISLCGIQRDQTTADFRKRLQPSDAILLGSDLSQAVVTGALTSVDLSYNNLTDYGENMTGVNELAAALGVNGALTALNLSSNRLDDEGVSAVCKAIQSNKETKLASLNFENNGIGPVGANAVAAMVAVTGGLTSIDLSGNQLCGIWTDNHGYQGTYTAEGITAIAEALRVNGALTEVR